MLESVFSFTDLPTLALKLVGLVRYGVTTCVAEGTPRSEFLMCRL